jgi:hypothetical protein
MNQRQKYVFRGIISRFLLRLGISSIPKYATCLNCEYNSTYEDGWAECDPPGFVPESIYRKYEDDQLPKHCGFWKQEAIL